MLRKSANHPSKPVRRKQENIDIPSLPQSSYDISPRTPLLHAYTDICNSRGVLCTDLVPSNERQDIPDSRRKFPYVIDPRTIACQHDFFVRTPYITSPTPLAYMYGQIEGIPEARAVGGIPIHVGSYDPERKLSEGHLVSLVEGVFVGSEQRASTNSFSVPFGDFLEFPSLSSSSKPGVVPGGAMLPHIFQQDRGVCFSGDSLYLATTIIKTLDELSRHFSRAVTRIMQSSNTEEEKDRLMEEEMNKPIDVSSIIASTDGEYIGKILEDWPRERKSAQDPLGSIQVLKTSSPIQPASEQEDRACFFIPYYSFIKKGSSKEEYRFALPNTSKIAVSFGPYYSGAVASFPETQSKSDKYAVVIVNGVTPQMFFSVFFFSQCPDIRYATRFRFFNLSPYDVWTARPYRNKFGFEDWSESRSPATPSWGILDKAILAHSPYEFWSSLMNNRTPFKRQPGKPCMYMHLVTDRKDGKPKTTVCFDENPEDEDFFKTIPLDSQGVFYLFYPYLRHPLLFAPTFGVLYDFDDLMVSDTSSTHVFDQTHFSFPELGTSTNRARVSASVGDTFSTILDKAIRDKESMD